MHGTRTLWLSGILHAFTHLYHVLLIPLYVLMLDDERMGLVNVDQSTSLVTVLMLSYYLPSYAMGVLADRFSKRKLLAWGLALNAAGFLALSFASGYWMAVGCVLIAGIGGSFYHPAATALVARLYPNATGKALGLVGIGASAGFFFGPLYAGWRAAEAGWRAPVFDLGLAGVAAAVLFYWLADEEPVEEQHVRDANQKVPMFPSPALWLLFVGAALAFSLRDFSGGAVASLGSLFLQKVQGLGTQKTGLILSAIFLASAISNPLFGKLSDRNQAGWIRVVLVIAGVLVLLFPHVPVGWSAVVLACYGFFFMASFPMVEAMLMRSVPHQVRGRVFGLFITIGGFLGNFAHWAMGAWVNSMGPGAASAESYYAAYAMVAGFIVASLAGVHCLNGLRRREVAAGELPAAAGRDKT